VWGGIKNTSSKIEEQKQYKTNGGGWGGRGGGKIAEKTETSPDLLKKIGTGQNTDHSLKPQKNLNKVYGKNREGYSDNVGLGRGKGGGPET